MTPPAWGIPLVLVLGVLAIAAATWLDLARTRRDPKSPALPGAYPTADPQVTEEHDLPLSPPTADASAELGLLERRGDASTLPGGAPDGRFLNHPRKGLAILLAPAVLVSDADVTSPRDLTTVLAAARRRGRPLVWVAPGFSPEAVGLLRANAVTARVPNLPIELGDPLHLRRAVAYTGGRLVAASDLAADWLPDDVWGTCAGWIADLDDSWVVPDSGAADGDG